MSPKIFCATIKSLIIRSRWSLNTFCLIEPNHVREDVDGTSLKLSFYHFPSMTDPVTSWSLPASAFMYIHHGALPNLVNTECFVHSDGFGAFLGMIDSYILFSR